MEGRRGGRETVINCPLHAPRPGNEPAAQACALTGNWTTDLLLCRRGGPTTWATLITVGQLLFKNFSVYFLFVIITCMLSQKGWHLISFLHLALRGSAKCRSDFQEPLFIPLPLSQVVLEVSIPLLLPSHKWSGCRDCQICGTWSTDSFSFSFKKIFISNYLNQTEHSVGQWDLKCSWSTDSWAMCFPHSPPNCAAACLCRPCWMRMTWKSLWTSWKLWRLWCPVRPARRSRGMPSTGLSLLSRPLEV